MVIHEIEHGLRYIEEWPETQIGNYLVNWATAPGFAGPAFQKKYCCLRLLEALSWLAWKHGPRRHRSKVFHTWGAMP